MKHHDTPLVSVVVPVRNGEEFLARTLESALRQSYSHLEVIVVDDGSTDGSAAIASKFANADERVRCIAATGSGVAAARNQAIELSRGSYIAPLDADDLWFPAKIERQLLRASEPDRPVYTYAWSCLIDADDRLLDLSRPFDEKTLRMLEGDVFLPAIYKPFITNGSNPLIERGALEAAGGYDTTLPRRDDWDLCIRLAQRERFALVPEFLVAYRQSATSRSHGERAQVEAHELILERVQRAYPQVPRALLRWSLSECYAFGAARSLSEGRTLAALRLFGRAFLLDPGQLLRPAPWRSITRLALRPVVGSNEPRSFDLDRPPEPGRPMRPHPWPAALPTPFEWLEQRRYRWLQSTRSPAEN